MRKAMGWYLFLLPLFAGFGIFLAYPVIYSLWLSFIRSKGMGGEWVGLANYKYIFEQPIFLNALYNTFYLIFIQLPIELSVALVFANLINRCVYARMGIKLIYLIPYLTSLVAITLIWTYLYDPGPGPLNWVLRFFGFEGIGWINDPSISKISLVFFSVWYRMGYSIIIYIAGLQAIPSQLYEAARIDGASSRKIFFHITVPLLKPTTIFLFITGTIWGMRRFTDVYMFGSAAGNPARSIQTVVAYIYEQGFTSLFFGIASAAAWILFIVIISLTLINFRVMVFRKKSI